jgi:DNA-binding response OmpR family regulator
MSSSACPVRPAPAPSDAAVVLVVEDEVLIRMAVADYLRDCGYVVLEAGDAAEARTVLLQGGHDVDVVFSDINMPGAMNGFGLARWVREHLPGVAVILTSGVTSAAREAESLCLAGPLLAKPYDHAALADRIKQGLARAQRRGAAAAD